MFSGLSPHHALTPRDLRRPVATVRTRPTGEDINMPIVGLQNVSPSSLAPTPHPLRIGRLVPTLPLCGRHHRSPTLTPATGPVGDDLTEQELGGLMHVPSQSPPFSTAHKFHRQRTSTCLLRQRHHPPHLTVPLPVHSPDRGAPLLKILCAAPKWIKRIRHWEQAVCLSGACHRSHS